MNYKEQTNLAMQLKDTKVSINNLPSIRKIIKQTTEAVARRWSVKKVATSCTIEENLISKNDRIVKVTQFPWAAIEDKHNYNNHFWKRDLVM